MSENHCAALDFNNFLYTWGIEEHGELGFYNEAEVKVCEPIRVNLDKKPFLVNKIKCGKFYTAGINNKGIPFLFGNKNKQNNNISNNNNIIFFSFIDNENIINYNLKAKDIYCGENFLIILLEMEKILIYSFNDGLFEIKLSNKNENTINYIISKINIIDNNFYILDEENKLLFEFVHFNKNLKSNFSIYDFYQNDYKINPNIKLSIIEMPFFVKFLFFWIECSENEKKEFDSQNNKMFHKLNENVFYNNFKKGPNINENILFGNNRKKIQLLKVEYENLFNKKESHFFLKGESIYSHSIKNYHNNIDNNNIDTSFQFLNIPISKNYGNKNDAKEENKIDVDLINNTYKTINTTFNHEIHKQIDNNNFKRKAINYYNYDNFENHNNFYISNDKKEDIKDSNIEANENFKKINEKKHRMNKNNITLDNKEINNNISLIKKREKNSFLIQNNLNYKTNDNIEEIEERYSHIEIKNNKQRSYSQMKGEKNYNYHNISSITTNTFNKKKEENEFDNLLKNINNRKLMLNHPVKIENNTINTKKILAQIGKTKSKTEMLIKELHETFFGKDNDNNYNKNKNYNGDINNQYKEKELLKKKNYELQREMKEKEKIEEEKLNKEMEKKIDIEKYEIKQKEIIKKEKMQNEKIKEKEKNERLIKEKKNIEKNEKERIEKELKEKIRRENEEKNKKEKDRLEEEKLRKIQEEKERREKEKREELENLKKMRLEKEKLEKELKEIKTEKDKEFLIKEKLEMTVKENVEKINTQKILEEERMKRKQELLEKELREKLENEYKEKYEKEKLKNEEERKKEREKIEKEKNELLKEEKKLVLEKVKELGKKEEKLQILEKEKNLMEQQRKNLLITSEINNFIEGKNLNNNIEKSIHNYKFLPERLKTENENEFVMKGVNKKNYNYTISGNQQFNIKNNQIDKIKSSDNNNQNLNNNDEKNNKNEFNLNIEDIVSNRDIIFDNIENNINSSEKIESFDGDNRNILNDLPLKLNNNTFNNVLNEKAISKKIGKNSNNNSETKKNIINYNNIEENDNSIKFTIEENNKNDLNINKEKEKDDSLEMTIISNKEKDKEKINNQLNLNISDEENENEAKEIVLELGENKKKLNKNLKEKSKNKISEIIEEKQEIEMIQSLDDTMVNKENKNELNLQLPLPYNNYPEQPIVPVSEISTNNMRHISTYETNIISSTRKFEPKELDDITGSLRIFSNRSTNNYLFSMINNKNNSKPISQRTNNNNLNINSGNNNNLKSLYGIGVKNKNIPNLIKTENLFNESYKDTNPNENFKDQKMKIDELEQSKFLKESKNLENICIYNNNKILEEENKKIKLNKIIKLKNKEELINILNRLENLPNNPNNNQNLDNSLYFLIEGDMVGDINYQNSNRENPQIIKIKNNKITTFESESSLLDNSFKNEIFLNYNNSFKNNIFNNLNNFNNFNNMKNQRNFNNIIINNDNNFNNINYIEGANNNRLLNIKNNPYDNHHTFSEIKNINTNELQNQNQYERHTYVGKNNINIINSDEQDDLLYNRNERNINMVKGIQIKITHKRNNKNKSRCKDDHRKHKRKTGIIEQIKKEQNEKKNNIMYGTFNKKNKNIIKVNNEAPYFSNKKQAYSKNSIAKINYNNNFFDYGQPINHNVNTNMNDQNNNIHHKKSKSVNNNKCLSCSPKKKMEDFSKYDLKEKNDFHIYDDNNTNNNNFIFNKNSNYKEEEFKNIININNKIQEQENNSLFLLRQKYLEFLIKVYGSNNNIPINRENEELDNMFLKGLVKNEVPIEKINLNLLKCSNDMKNFIRESLENFKLQLLKEKIEKINGNKNISLNNNQEKNKDNKNNNNLNGLIQLDYEDEMKDKSNILEPIELEKSNFNLNFRKSFIESLSRVRNNNVFYNSENIMKK